ncbi:MULTISPECIES: D-alanyl-D-alanine carboxypeptidase family protein [Mycolicibacterium]|uniref:D-alanyl-D-alanine carboxypeptidase n=1 Tax=Mycolicibacterium gilvum (strain DSM 45189 / LMG 24558 / Spyr1) TaxID=278137 RepID=E6THC6_MYCSR|nr:D-alanyl-D-alanine carboxypeptidase [Mycolicibacterium gilvum Spyr1]MBV5242775.1 serine hydrolase [Mycolicibacterium sp. PAM1]
MRRRLAGLAFALGALLTASVSVAAPGVAQPAAQPAAAQPIPDGPAKAWLVADLDTGRVLASKDPYGTYAPASTIKVLLAMTVLDHLRPDSFARANESHTKIECSCAGLTPGQAYTTAQLVSAILMVSGNDAATMLGDMLGGQRVAVAAMNRKAALVGARSTKASSTSGLDGPGWESVTTPHDLAVIMRAALKYPLIAQIMRSPTAPFPGKTLHNQNELLSRYPGDLGGKTGFTNLARKTYVGAAQRGNRRLVVVQMYGTGDLYGQAMQLLDYGFSQP